WMDPVYIGDAFLAIVTIILVLETCPQVVGGFLSLITGCFLAYFFLGHICQLFSPTARLTS
ncbi:MAG: hypothetical protein ACUVWV_04730, partial [Thermodesulfobacteriota bacterium]